MAGQKKALVFLAEGFEEVEALTPVDYLRRSGVTVVTAAVTAEAGGMVSGSHGIGVKSDASLASLEAEGGLKAGQWDAVICPGGLPGAANIAASSLAGRFIQEMFAAGKIVAAICAAPAMVLAPLGILSGKKYTCFPGMEKEVPESASKDARWSGERVVRDGSLITSRGAGTAGEFAVEIIAALVSKTAADALAEKVLMLRK